CYNSISIFFFSSRRRHTRSKRDWSSDVCSSDLQSRCRASPVVRMDEQVDVAALPLCPHPQLRECRSLDHQRPDTSAGKQSLQVRSEERRVGKEGGAGAGGTEERKEWRAEEVGGA